jgi:hypothetical protein
VEQKEMILRKVLIRSEKLRSIPKRELTFFVQLGIFLNELLMLHKLLAFSKNYDPNHEITRKAQAAQSLIIARIWAEKLFEGWRLLDRKFWGSKISKKYDGLLNSQGRECLNNLKSYFSRENPIKKVRNCLGAHYFTSTDAVLNQLARMTGQDIAELYIGQEEENCLYHLSHVLITLAITDAVGESDREAAVMSFFKDLSQTAEWFIGFSQEFIIRFAMQYLEGNAEEVEVPDPPNFRDVKLPFFIMGPP